MFISGYANTENVFYCLNIKKQNETKTKKANGSKQRSFMSAYFSLGAAGGSRKIQSQEPIKSTGEKLARKKKQEISDPLFFPVYDF